jgi:hypothetical protein
MSGTNGPALAGSGVAPVSDLPERLRAGAQAVRETKREMKPPWNAQMDGVLLQTIPAGVDSQVRIIWRPGTQARPPVLSIRLWMESGPDCFFPRKDVGLEVLAWRLPELGEAVAAALELYYEHVTTVPARRPK